MIIFNSFVIVGELWFSQLSVGQQSTAKENVSVPNVKVWSTFSKVVGVGNAHKCFILLQFLIAKRLEHNGENRCDSNRKQIFL